MQVDFLEIPSLQLFSLFVLLVMSALLHFGAHPGYVKTSLVFSHLQAGQLDEARHIIKV